MHVVRTHALEAFRNYVDAYDPTNPRIALKVAHTLRVAELSADIAAATGEANPNLDADDVDLAWLIGLLHDIGRFEQVRRFDTFNDAASVPHAALGVEVLFENTNPLFGAFVEDMSEAQLISTAIATHADLALPPDLDARTRTFCNICRDADKLDILKVNCICPIEDIYGVTDAEMNRSTLSDEVVRTFYARRTVPRAIRRHPADILVSHICFAWELVFARSRALVAAQGYLAQMLAHEFEDVQTRLTFDAMAQYMKEELGLKTCPEADTIR